MPASRARLVAFVITLSLTLILGLVPGAAAADSAPPPTSMAAVGDSITQAASSGGSLGADYPENSWSTGTNGTVNSHYVRLTGLNAAIAGNAYNGSVSGAKVFHLNGQMSSAELAALQPDYLTVLIGGNDLCTPTIEEMTSVNDFTDQFRTAMRTLLVGDPATGVEAVSPETMVYVVGIPDVHQLWELFKNNFFARAVWSAGNICQSLLANPTSNQTADVERRRTFRERNIAYNAALAQVCGEFSSRCHYDADNDVFTTRFARSHVSGDYFHPSIEGQALLADVTWTAGYQWTSEPAPNVAPTASFGVSCSGLSCAFTDTSSDSDGSIASRAWTFGDGATSTATNPSHTYTADGTYTVSLTVKDDDGATGSTSRSVTVSSGTVTITLSVVPYKVKGVQTADLTWAGATSTNVDIYRNGALVTTTANDGAHTDNIDARGGGSYTYSLCEAGSTTCSGDVTVSY